MTDSHAASTQPRRNPGGPVGRDLFAGYSKEERPLVAYAELVGLYHLAFAMFIAAARAVDRPLPRRVNWADILLVGVATFKMSRLVAKDVVTSPLRAPFATFEEMAGEGEVKERPRGTGMQLALGELLTCPFCMATWIAAFMAYGLVLSPPFTRFIAGIFTAQSVADFLQLAYGAAAVSTKKNSG
jgi:Protein of unknown function (DUF1360)